MPELKTSASLGADMFQAMSSYVRDYKEAHETARNLDLPTLKDIDHVVLTGMGGSGIGASLVEALVRDKSPRPVFVLRDYHLPAWVSKRSLVVATSYSGNTEETLYAVGTARERGATIAGITSGGLLGEFLAKNHRPQFAVPTGRQPRAALPLLLGALGGMMERLGIASFRLEPSEENILHNRHVQLQPKLAGTEDLALRFSETLRSRHPTIVAQGHLGPVAVRWKCQFNENAKMFARAEELPEASHNDVVPWALAERAPTDAVILLRRPREPKEVAIRFEFLAELCQRREVPLLSPRAECKTPLGQCLEHLMLGDYTSVYTAILRHVDPTPVPIIVDLKARLAKDGLASEARKRLGL